MQVRFNPLPAPKYREIGSHTHNHAWYGSFNPSPKYREIDIQTVSIRSLHRSTGRLKSVAPKLPIGYNSFNPLPAPKYREIECVSNLKRPKPRFNPLPAPKYREMKARDTLWLLGLIVSIRSLHRSTGRSRDGTSLFQPGRSLVRKHRVSIRSLHRSTGRSESDMCRQVLPGLIGFNPLPAPKYREMLVAVTSVIPKGYTSRCANPLSYASFD